MRNSSVTGKISTALSVLGFLDSADWCRSHRLTVPGDKYRPDYDGIAELWFDDVEALLAARQSPEWKASREDEANFNRPQQNCLHCLRGAHHLGRHEVK